MKKTLIALTALVIVSALILAACGTPEPTTPAPGTTAPPATSPATTAPSPTQPVQAKTIKFSYTMPQGASVGAGFEWFAAEFEKRTEGRYKVDTYPAQSLVKIAAALDAVKVGAVELAFTSTATFTRQFPLSLITQLPAMGFPMENVEQFQAATAAFKEYIATVPEVQAEYTDWVLVTPMVLDPYNLVSKRKEIKQAEDFKGLKVGGSGPKMEIAKFYGGAHVAQAPPETYLNMDKGVTDAAFITFAQVYDYKIHEIADFYSMQEFGSGAAIILMNKEFYAGMSEEDVQIMEETWADAIDVSAEGVMSQIEKGKQSILTAGKSIYTPTETEMAAWKAAAAPALEKWKDDCRVAGLSDDLINMAEQKWLEIRDKYID